MKATSAWSPVVVPAPPLPILDTPHVLFMGVGLVLAYLIVPPLIVLLQTSLWVATSATQGNLSWG